MARITNPSFNQPRDFIEEDRGTLVAAGRYVSGVKDYSFTVEGPSNFEQIGWFLQTASKGSVTATTVGSSASRYIFSPNTTTTGDDLQAASFEFGDDTQSYIARYCEATSWTLSFDPPSVGQSAPVNLSVNYVTNSLGSNTKTSGLTAPTVESILATGAHWYLGSTSTAFAALSEVTASLRSFSMTSENNLGRKVFVGDGTTYSNIGRGRRVTTFELVVEGNSDGVTRFVEWDIPHEKRMRLTFAGTTVSGSSPATAKQLWIDARILFTSIDVLGEIDTNTVYRLSGRFLEDSTHSTANSDYTITLTNDQSSYD